MLPRIAISISCLALLCASFALTPAGRSEVSYAPSLAEMHPETIELLENDKISILAESGSQRRYAERFSEIVYEAVFETTGEPAGKGLVVIGNAKDPHPILLLKEHFDTLYGAGSEDEKANIQIIFGKTLQEFEKGSEEMRKEVGLELDSIAHVVPMPLEGPILNLYQIAKQEEFDTAKINSRIQDPDSFQQVVASFEDYDWAVYLPPKNAIDKALKEILPAVMKKEKMGFFKRSLVRGAVATFKPLIRDAMEGVRKSMMYDAILSSTSDLSEGDRKELTEAYLGSLMPRGNLLPGKKTDRSLDAIREQKRKNAEYAKDPYIEPAEIQPLDLEAYASYKGEYKTKGDQTIRVYREGDSFLFRRAENKPRPLLPVGGSLFTVEDRKMTIEFLADESGKFMEAEIRRDRHRETIARKD